MALNCMYLVLGGLHSAVCARPGFHGCTPHRRSRGQSFKRSLIIVAPGGLDPIGALAHLQLGRVFVLSGDNKIKAKAAYEAFLAVWREADPDVPILKIAKAES